MSRFPLQICTAVLALIPIATGIVTLLGIRDPIYRPLGLPPSPILDSNLRFFGGIWLGLGLAMLWLYRRSRPRGALSGPVGGRFPGWCGSAALLDHVGSTPRAVYRLHAARASRLAAVHLLAIQDRPVSWLALRRSRWVGREFEHGRSRSLTALRAQPRGEGAAGVRHTTRGPHAVGR